MKNTKAKKIMKSIFFTATLAILMVFPAMAAGPLESVNKLTEILFGLLRAVGGIAAAWGVLQIGISFQSHDSSQRTQGIMTVVGGLVIMFTKEIIGLIS